MDVTHIPKFGNLKYVHVFVDTYSGFIFSTLQTGKAWKNVIAHMLSAIAILKLPTQLKTDNGPGYVKNMFSKF